MLIILMLLQISVVNSSLCVDELQPFLNLNHNNHKELRSRLKVIEHYPEHWPETIENLVRRGFWATQLGDKSVTQELMNITRGINWLKDYREGLTRLENNINGSAPLLKLRDKEVESFAQGPMDKYARLERDFNKHRRKGISSALYAFESDSSNQMRLWQIIKFYILAGDIENAKNFFRFIDRKTVPAKAVNFFEHQFAKLDGDKEKQESTRILLGNDLAFDEFYNERMFWVYKRKRQPENIISIEGHLEELIIKSPETLKVLFYANYDTGRYDSAKRYFIRKIELENSETMDDFALAATYVDMLSVQQNFNEIVDFTVRFPDIFNQIDLGKKSLILQAFILSKKIDQFVEIFPNIGRYDLFSRTLGRTLQTNLDLEQVEQIFLELYQRDQSLAQHIFLLAKSAYRQKKYELAKKILSIVASDPSIRSNELVFLKASISNHLGWFTQSIRYLEELRAPLTNDQLYFMHHFRGRNLFDLNKISEAAEELEQAIKLRPNSELDHLLLGHFYVTFGDYEKAFKHLIVNGFDPRIKRLNFELMNPFYRMKILASTISVYNYYGRFEDSLNLAEKLIGAWKVELSSHALIGLGRLAEAKKILRSSILEGHKRIEVGALLMSISYIGDENWKLIQKEYDSKGLQMIEQRMEEFGFKHRIY